MTVEVTLDNGNYTVEDFELKADITAKELAADVSGVVVSKVYDGTAAPGEVSGSASVTGTVAGESVNVNVTAGEYPERTSGTTIRLSSPLSSPATRQRTMCSATLPRASATRP